MPPTNISTITGKAPTSPTQMSNVLPTPAAASADPDAVTAVNPAAAAAGTAAAPGAITATNPAAPTAYSAVVNMSEPVAKAEGEAVSAALATLRSEVATYETAISALVVDVTAIRAEVVKLVTDVATRRTEINALRTEIIALIVDVTQDIAALDDLKTKMRAVDPPLLAT